MASNEQNLQTEMVSTGSIIQNITNYRGLSLAIFGSLVAITGQVTNSGLVTAIGVVLLIPGILREISDSSTGLIEKIDKTDLTFLFAIVILGVVLLTRTSYILNFMLLSGFTMVIYSLNRSKPEQVTKVEYKFTPRTFKEDQDNPVKVSEVFSDMFTKPAPFPVSGYSSQDPESVGRRSIEQIVSPFS